MCEGTLVTLDCPEGKVIEIEPFGVFYGLNGLHECARTHHENLTDENITQCEIPSYIVTSLVKYT